MSLVLVIALLVLLVISMFKSSQLDLPHDSVWPTVSLLTASVLSVVVLYLRS